MKFSPAKTFFVILLLFAAVRAQLTIVENTTQQLTLSWNLEDLDTSSFTEGENRLTSLSFTGSNVSIVDEEKHVLPGYTVVVGVPPGGEIGATIVPLSVKTVVLSYPPSKARGNQDSYQSEVPRFVDRWLSEPEYMFFRSMRTARMIIRPVQYDPSTHTVTILTKATFTVRFPNAVCIPSGVRSKADSDFERMLQRLIVNYDAAQCWRQPAFQAKKRSSSPFPLYARGKLYKFRIGDGHEGFNEGTINENGLIKISGKRLKELFGTISVAGVKLYAAHKGMLPDTLPSDGTIPEGVNEIPLMRFDRNNNNLVDDEDRFIAYVTGASDWEFNQNNGKFYFNLDLYDDYRTYWITHSETQGLTIEKYQLISSNPKRELTKFTDVIQYRKSLMRREGNPGNRRWVWKILSNRQQFFQQKFYLPGLVSDDTGTIEIFGERQSGGSLSASFGGNEDDTSLCNNCNTDTAFTINEWGDSTIYIRFSGESGNPRFNLSHINITYPRRLEIGDTPTVLSILPDPQDSGVVVAYNLSINTSQTIYIIRVPADEKKISLIDTVKGVGSYRWIDTSSYDRRYIVCNESSLKPLPEIIEQKERQPEGTNIVRDLRSTRNSTGFLIITHPIFLPAADSLARHKESKGFYKPVVVDVEDIYRFFSGGDKDVAAIRNFVGYVCRYWRDGERLDYLLFMGTGHYDAKNVVSSSPDFIPPFIQGDVNIESFFAAVSHLSREPQLAVGRIACSSLEQAWAVVRKIVQMEDSTEADVGEWRNRAVFVADDDMQADRPDVVANTTPHHLSSDRTAAIVDSLWPSMDLRKVYLFEYEWDASHQKPGASRALINEINNGVGYINFFGHGADITWTDEYILTGDMVAGMNNKKKYPVISMFSCSVGRFDVPGFECLSAILANAANKGAIASIASTREAYASANENLAKAFYRFLFDSSGARSIGLALLAAQINSTGNGHTTYCILGDPSVRAVRHTHSIELSIDDKDDTLSALQKVTIRGSIFNKDGSAIDESFGKEGSYVALGLFNAPDTTTRKDGGENKNVRYVMPGTPVFLGRTSVVNGRFTQTVLIPQNLAFDKHGVSVRAYAWKEGSFMAAVGNRRNMIFHGSLQSGSINDTVGPSITLRPAYDNERLSGLGASFTDRIITQVPAKCEIEIYDESGIDAAGIGPDEGVTLELEGVFARQNVNNKFQFKQGDFRQGMVSVIYDEKALGPGDYTMLVTARDLLGNLSKARFTLIVTDKQDLRLDHVFNFPNPVRLGQTTRFYCHSNYTSERYYGADVQLTIKIYTLGGKLLKVIRNARNGEIWDLRDQRGFLLSPDIYLYQIIAEEDASDQKTVKSKIMKLVILPPK